LGSIIISPRRLSVLARDEMPADNAALTAIPVEFPSVPSEKVVSPNRIVPDLLNYLGREGFAPDGALQFLRNALVEGTLYLIWSFETGGEPAFATASVRNGQWRLGCGINHWGLTPEQFILADYHNCM
jgi:hypothetical protein